MTARIITDAVNRAIQLGSGSGDAAHRETADAAPSGAGTSNSPQPGLYPDRIDAHGISALLVACAIFAFLAVCAALQTWGPRAHESGVVLW